MLQELTEEAVSETVSIKEEEEAMMKTEKVKEAVITQVVTESHGGVVAVVLPAKELSNAERHELTHSNEEPVKVACCMLPSLTFITKADK